MRRAANTTITRLSAKPSRPGKPTSSAKPVCGKAVAVFNGVALTRLVALARAVARAVGEAAWATGVPALPPCADSVRLAWAVAVEFSAAASAVFVGLGVGEAWAAVFWGTGVQVGGRMAFCVICTMDASVAVAAMAVFS